MLNRPATAPCDLSIEISKLVNDGRERFLQVGGLLRSFLENLPPGEGKLRALDKVLAGTGICRRTATYWMEIDRVYAGIGIPEWELADLGWTKLSILAKRITPENASYWLPVARSSSVQALRQRLRGEGERERTVVLRFRDVEYSSFVKTLLDHGASIHGERTLVNKEAAVLSMCRSTVPATRRRGGDPGAAATSCQIVSIDKNVPVPAMHAARSPARSATASGHGDMFYDTAVDAKSKMRP